MKPTKMRNKQIFRATYTVRSKQVSSPLSEELRKKYGKRSVRIVEGDSVKILRGEYKGIDGKVSKVSTEKSSVAVEGVKKEKAKGDKFDVYIHASNVIVTNLNTEDKWRINKLEGKEKTKNPKPVAESKPKETKSVETKPKETPKPKETKAVKKEVKE